MAEFVIRGAGEVFLKHRQRKNWTLETVAEKVGSTKSQIAKYESNRVGVSDVRLASLAKAFGVLPERLAHECLLFIKPEVASLPIGKLLSQPVPTETKPSKSVKRKVKAVTPLKT